MSLPFYFGGDKGSKGRMREKKRKRKKEKKKKEKGISGKRGNAISLWMLSKPQAPAPFVPSYFYSLI